LTRRAGGGAYQFTKRARDRVHAIARFVRRQLIFLTSGILEIETSEGRRFVCRPGDLIFAEDLRGKGHITRSLRDTRGFVPVTVPEDFDVSGWPLVEA